MVLGIVKRAYVLENGQIAASGSSNDLKSDKKIQEAYLGGTALKRTKHPGSPS